VGSEEGFMNMSLDIRQRIEGAEDQKEVEELRLLHLLQSTQNLNLVKKKGIR
jgi:hypothetical protein